MSLANESEALKAFIAQCEEFKAGRLVMVQQKIRLLLKCMAYYPQLKALVEDCGEGFDYSKEYNKCITNLGTYTTFRLPSVAKKKVALTVALLLDFDEPNRDFIRFIREFYPSFSHEESYSAFCDNVITPFEEAAVLLLKSPDGKEKAAIYETDAKLEEVNIALAEQAANFIGGAVEIVRSAHLSESTRDELVFMLDNFLSTLKLRDAQIIKGYWLALRYTLKSYKLSSKFISNMDELLKTYNAI